MMFIKSSTLYHYDLHIFKISLKSISSFQKVCQRSHLGSEFVDCLSISWNLDFLLALLLQNMMASHIQSVFTKARFIEFFEYLLNSLVATPGLQTGIFQF